MNYQKGNAPLYQDSQLLQLSSQYSSRIVALKALLLRGKGDMETLRQYESYLAEIRSELEVRGLI